jgi:hypothetical protein
MGFNEDACELVGAVHDPDQCLEPHGESEASAFFEFGVLGNDQFSSKEQVRAFDLGVFGKDEAQVFCVVRQEVSADAIPQVFRKSEPVCH